LQLEKRVLRKERISDGWFRRFLERQPQLRLHKGDRTLFVQLNAMNNNEALDIESLKVSLITITCMISQKTFKT